MGIVERLRAGVQRSVVQLGGGHSPDPAPVGGFLSLPLVGQLARPGVEVHLEDNSWNDCLIKAHELAVPLPRALWTFNML
jgi:hypothetical protein